MALCVVFFILRPHPNAEGFPVDVTVSSAINQLKPHPKTKMKTNWTLFPSLDPSQVTIRALALIWTALAFVSLPLQAQSDPLAESTSKFYAKKAEEHVENARKAMEKEEWKEANRLSLAALKLDKDSIDALRLVYLSSARLKSPKTLSAAHSLFLHPDCPFEERVRLLALFQLAGDNLRFTECYNALGEEEKKDPDVLFLKTRFLATRGAGTMARQLIEEFYEEGGEDRRFDALLANMLVVSRDEEDRKRGQEIIVKLLEEKDPQARSALLSLWNVPPGTLQADLFPADIIDQAASLPEAGPREYLIGAKVEIVRNAEQREEQQKILEAAIGKYGGSDPLLMSGWLVQFGRFDLILEMIDETRGRESLELYDARLVALAAAKGPEAAEAWLEEPHEDSSEIMTWLSRAKLAKAKSDDLSAVAHWYRAYNLAEEEENGDSLVAAYRTALQLGNAGEAVKALLKASEKPGPAFPRSLELQPVVGYLYEEDRLDDLLQLTRVLLQREPSNLFLNNNFLYLSLLLGEPNEKLLELAKKLVEERPNVLGLRTTLAFGLLQKGEFEEAEKALQGEDLDWEVEAGPADWAIRELTLLKTGKAEEAEEIAGKYESENITSAERDAFAKLRAES